MPTVGEKVTDTIVGAISKAVQDFALNQHADLKDIIGPRLQSYIDALPEGNLLRGEIEAGMHDSTFNDFIIRFIGMLIGMISGLIAMADPMNEAVRSTVWSTTPTKRMDIATAVKANWYGMITDEVLAEILLSWGYDGEKHEAMKAAMMPILPEGHIGQARLRGRIAPGLADKFLSWYGYDNTARGIIADLWWKVAPFDDLVRFAHHGLLGGGGAGQALDPDHPPQALVDGAGKLGINADLATSMWRSHFDHPAGSQALEMWHRGIITEAELSELLTLQGMDPQWQPALKTVSHPPIPRLVIRQLLHLGLMTEDQALQAHKALGYDDATSRQMVDYCKAFYGLENADPTADDRELTKAEVLDGYHKGVITADQARTALQGLNYADTTIDFYLAREDLKATQDLKAAYLTRYQALYVNGIKSADETTQELATLGLGDTEIKQQLALWYLQRISQVQRPTKAELIRWYKAGIINKETWTAEMKLEGFDDRYISWYDAEISQTPAAAQ